MNPHLFSIFKMFIMKVLSSIQKFIVGIWIKFQARCSENWFCFNLNHRNKKKDPEKPTDNGTEEKRPEETPTGRSGE